VSSGNIFWNQIIEFSSMHFFVEQGLELMNVVGTRIFIAWEAHLDMKVCIDTSPNNIHKFQALFYKKMFTARFINLIPKTDTNAHNWLLVDPATLNE
jgi:hypothetical protein